METVTRLSLKEYALTEEGQRVLTTKVYGVNLSTFTLENVQRAIEFVSNKENAAAGLAAPQIGLSESWFVMKKHRDQSILVVVNPTILGRMGNKQHIEACFSEQYPARVKRSKSVTVQYQTLDSVIHKETLEGMDSQVFQHEYSHLLGRLLSTEGQVINNDK